MVVLYHERQESALCGLHALNNLCQGPYYAAGDLATIAHDLDSRERQLGLDKTHASENVDASGNFSIQVLDEALRRAHAVSLEDTRKGGTRVGAASAPPCGYILHRSDHWYALRKVGGVWYELNSADDAPKRLVDVDAAIAQLVADGWSVFAAHGELPPPMRRDSSIAPADDWFDTERAGTRGGGGGGFSAAPLRAAEPRFEAFGGAGQRLGAPPAEQQLRQQQHAAADPLAAALALSHGAATASRLESRLPPEPEAGGANVQVRLPDGSRAARRFGADALVQSLADWVCAILASGGVVGGGRWRLHSRFPPLQVVVCADGEAATSSDAASLAQTFASAGLVPSAALHVSSDGA